MNTELMQRKRKELGLTQQGLADKCGLSRVSISNYESGKAEPTMENIGILSKNLEVEIFELLTVEDIYLENIKELEEEMRKDLLGLIIAIVDKYTKGMDGIAPPEAAKDLIKSIEGITGKIFLYSKAKQCIVARDDFRYSIIGLEMFETIAANLIVTIKLLTHKNKKVNENNFDIFLKTEKIFRQGE